MPPKHALNFYAATGWAAGTWFRSPASATSAASAAAIAGSSWSRSATTASAAKRIPWINTGHVRPLAELEESRPATKNFYVLIHHRRFE
jgi:hypothetical protein